MVSILRSKLYPERTFKWYCVKFIVMITFTLIVLGFTIMTNNEQTSKNDVRMHLRRLLSNNTEYETCEIEKQPFEKQCDYYYQKIKEGVCEESIYPKLMYCYLKNAKPAFYVIAVCLFINLLI